MACLGMGKKKKKKKKKKKTAKEIKCAENIFAIQTISFYFFLFNIYTTEQEKYDNCLFSHVVILLNHFYLKHSKFIHGIRILLHSLVFFLCMKMQLRRNTEYKYLFWSEPNGWNENFIIHTETK